MNPSFEYINRVKSGEIRVNKQINLTIQRTLNDLEQSKNEQYPYYFDEAQATKVIKFIECLPSPDDSSKTMKLANFQKFILSELFGWRKKSDGSRRFSECFISIARKSGKSMLFAYIAITYLLMEKIPANGRQIILTSNTREVAHLSFDIARNALINVGSISPAIRNRLTINKETIEDKRTQSIMKVTSATDEHLNGLKSDLALMDEGATQGNFKEMYGVLKSGQNGASSKNSLLAMISTSGFNLQSDYKKFYDIYTESMRDNTAPENTFIAVWELDSIEQAMNDDDLILANPLLENKEIASVILPKLAQDRENGIKLNTLNNFYVKSCNMWFQNRSNSYIDDDILTKNMIDKPNLNGLNCVIGLDLSVKRDITGISIVSLLPDAKLFVDSYGFVGNGATEGGITQKEKADKIPYQSLERAGMLSITTDKNGIIQYDEVIQFIKNYIADNHLNPLAVCYDPFNASIIEGKMEEIAPAVKIRQRNIEMSEAIKNLNQWTREGRVQFSKNELFRIGNRNVQIVENDSGLVYGSKKRNGNKIDNIFATWDAMTFITNENLMDPDRVIFDDDYYSNYDF
ncbi:terminase TerL endonuclease subunit [Pediococcus pentosaceus]|uniref:terminase TerL endonuclease subunit n=1 Tax=Pediococcus pentosaceus TaxID=1255 RepID=UPI00132A4BFB|nr:terminase TerL endonuclease subunit [Pediococcus pentosaceus]KAF0501108.1 hypothetical protein GBP22_09930 [Pediococcus pentosaceus]